ncbi:branched-chain amino acid ABC transporter substrate-binding protein [Alteromonas lipolytica]|nr:branched-chain amino acid ABC transporter substrate-binding protein [Alteromonas lipolytica]
MLWPALARSEALNIDIIYVQQSSNDSAQPLLLKKTPVNVTLAGAELAIKDSNTTGRFLQHHYKLSGIVADNEQQLVSELTARLNGQPAILLTDVSATTLKVVADLALSNGSVIINAGNADNSLRLSQCRGGLLHTLASRAMLTDALAQFFMARRWREWFLISGESAEDKAFAASVERSAKRFGAKIVERKEWSFDTDLRRSAQREVPLFTQGDDYDVVLVADESDLFGNYVPNNTWLPRPVAGTHGLTPKTWHWVLEQWGATQLQNRFYEQFGREMLDKDYAAWLAVRSISEAVTRTASNNPKVLYNYLISSNFELAAFKGRKLSFRPWNGQLRQPIPLVHPQGLTSLSPQEGYLHPSTDLDTLGFDKPEARCDMAYE